MATRLKPRDITSDEVKEILNLKAQDITATKLKYLFAANKEHEAKFQTNDKFTLPQNKFYNDKSIETTVGRYIYNLFCLPEKYLKKYGYMNEPLTGDKLSEIEGRCGYMIMDDVLTTKEYARYMDCSEWLSMNIAFFITPTIDNDIIMPLPDVMKKKDELFTQYDKELKEGDLATVNTVEGELLKMAKTELQEKDPPSFDLYASGEFNFNLHYKKSAIMVGATNDIQTGQVNVLKSNYTEGVSKDEYDKTAGLTVTGGLARGVFSQKYGYETKKYNSSLQSVSIDIDQKNIDCGTQRYLEITIPKELKSMFHYRFIIDGSSLVELTPENIDKYVGKKVKLRSPMMCKGDVLCEHCAGTMFRRMRLRDAGFVASNMTGSLLNLSMKKMHDSTVKIMKMNIDDFITER